MKDKIPKIIHYCWFGRGVKPKSTLQYIDGWMTLMPDYKLIEWNEDNFDIHICPYVEQAYKAGKFAFVSDYARGYALYEMGGVYLDTDVEVLRSFDTLLNHNSFWGFEAGNYVASSTIGIIPRHEIIKNYLDQYHIREFVGVNGVLDQTTNVQVVTQLWQTRGLVLDNKQQVVGDDNLILPKDYLSPYDYTVGTINRGMETYAIHHYGKTWMGPWARIKGRIKKRFAALFGEDMVRMMRKVLLRRNKVSAKMEK